MPDAPVNTKGAMNYLHHQHDTGANWYRACLMLQRMARGVPGGWPTAISAANAIPQSERIHQVENLRRGMDVWFRGPTSGSAGHVAGVSGRRRGFRADNPDGVLCWSNDVTSRHGQVGMVPLSYFHNNWGHTFLFGSGYINGYNFKEFDPKKPPAKPSKVASRIAL